MSTQSEKQCFNLVTDPGILGSRNCSLPVVGEIDGRPYCKCHSPEAKAKRQATSSARWADEAARFNKRLAEETETQRRADCFPDLLAALEGLQNVDGHIDSCPTHDDKPCGHGCPEVRTAVDKARKEEK